MNSQLLNSQTEPLSVLLTDSPEVVRLKRRFYWLEQRVQFLKRIRSENASAELALLDAEKHQIAAQIFGTPQLIPGMV